MNDRSPRLTRRRVLASLATAGVIGGASGAYSAAKLTDTDVFSGAMAAGSADLRVACESSDCSATGGVVSFAVEDVAPGEAGKRTFLLEVVDNPVRLWLGTDCPPSLDPVADVLEVRLEIAAACAGPGRQLYPDPAGGDWGTLRSFRTAFASGGRVDDPQRPCLAAGTEHCLRFAYRLPASASVPTSAETRLGLSLHAEQCRHVPESSAINPFPAAECDEPPSCPSCVELGKLEVENDRLDVGTYAFDELRDPFTGDGHNYELDVTSVTTKDDGEPVCVAVELLRDGQATLPMCAVTIKAGADHTVHELSPPSTSTGGERCVAAGDGSGPSRRKAISHVVVSVCSDAAEPPASGPGQGGER